MKRYFRVMREDICYLTFILESYDGLAVIRTVDPHQALIEIRVAPEREGFFEGLIKSLKADEGLKIIAETFDGTIR